MASGLPRAADGPKMAPKRGRVLKGKRAAGPEVTESCPRLYMIWGLGCSLGDKKDDVNRFCTRSGPKCLLCGLRRVQQAGVLKVKMGGGGNT